MSDELKQLITVNRVDDDEYSKKSRAILRAVLGNNVNELEDVLRDSSDEHFQFKHPEHDNSNVVNIACVESGVMDDVFRLLLRHVLQKHPFINLSDRKWYYWEPIHFAAFSVSWGKLKVIAQNLDRRKINALTLFSENALHVLLEYGKRIDSYDVYLTNGWDSRLCHVIAREKEDLVKCAKILIDAGVDVNHDNIFGETPLVLAIKYRYLKVIKLLLKRKEIDIKSRTDPVTGKSPQEILRENDIYVEYLGSYSAQTEDPKKTLFGFLKRHHEDFFLRYNNENIRQYANLLDGDNELNTSGSLLQLCFLKGYLEYKKEMGYEPSSIKDIMKTTMLRVFCKKGFARSIEHLLNNGADVRVRNRMFDYANVLEMSVELCYYPFLAVLFEHPSDQVSAEDIFAILDKVDRRFFRTHNRNFRHVLFVLIKKLEVLYDAEICPLSVDYPKRSTLNNLMVLYLEFNAADEYDDNIQQILKLNASLASARGGTKSPVELLDYEVLEMHLDQCLDKSDNVCYDSIVLDDGENYSETSTLHMLADDRQKKELLNHPVLILLIHSKWLKTNKFFYADLVLYTLLLLSLYIYMVKLEIGTVTPLIYYAFFSLLTLHTLKETVQLVLYRHYYFLDIANYLEMTTIASCYVNCFSKNEICMVVAILFSTAIFLYMLGQIPRFTKYMIIVSSTKYFFEYALFYFIQFFSFALCFFILLPPPGGTNSSNALGEIFKKLFDSLIFFIGQFDGDVADPPLYPVFGRVIVAIFAFCMTIILNNLLVGLIVTDMDVIQKTGKLLRQIKTVRYIIRIEVFLKQLRRFPCFRKFDLLKSTRIFNRRVRKHMHFESVIRESVFDEEDRERIKKIRSNENLKEAYSKNFLRTLYEHITSEPSKEKKSARGNREILEKLNGLHEKINLMSERQ
ncbi:transient receptor potential channel pyrexia-like [Cylas formicarius]|uniref:transient receptor potential channel pyrexia-like n=1 Tax=Cylas formicarius TaxID=197179 RepID=UPI002958AE4E|nr:transient receptor potential channel pyrexia-like [Cylas formicarius]